MVRRTLIASLLTAAFAVSPALANVWNTQLKDGVATSWRTATNCSFDTSGSSLLVTCRTGGKAKVGYTFTSSRPIVGTPTRNVDAATSGNSVARSAVTAAGRTVRVSVSVSGAGTVRIDSVGVGYYTR